MFLVGSKQTSDQRVEASIKIIKYLKGLLGGLMGPQMSLCILFKKDGDSYTTLVKEGWVITFPCEHGEHKNPLEMVN